MLSEPRLLPPIFTLAWKYYQITCGDGNDDLKSVYVLMRSVTLKRISIKYPENLKKLSSKTWKKLNTFQFIYRITFQFIISLRECISYSYSDPLICWLLPSAIIKSFIYSCAWTHDSQWSPHKSCSVLDSEDSWIIPIYLTMLLTSLLFMYGFVRNFDSTYSVFTLLEN